MDGEGWEVLTLTQLLRCWFETELNTSIKTLKIDGPNKFTWVALQLWLMYIVYHKKR